MTYAQAVMYAMDTLYNVLGTGYKDKKMEEACDTLLKLYDHLNHKSAPILPTILEDEEEWA